MNFLKSFLMISSIVMISNCVYAKQQNTINLSKDISTVKINADSVELVKLVAEISKDSLALTILKSQVEEKTTKKQETATIAQTIADKNNQAARRLSKDPLDKKLAKKADNLSSEARSSAKKARVASDALDKLNKNIASLERKIVKEQAKMDKLKVAS